MKNVLDRISIRKCIREKGTTFCIISAIFFTNILFLFVFSSLFYIEEAGKEMLKEASPIEADAIFAFTENEYKKIEKNPRVAELGIGTRVGIMQEFTGAGGIMLFHFQNNIAKWMHYYPQKGHLPQKGNEIVVSTQFLKDYGISFKEDTPVHLTYYMGQKKITDTFYIVGVYEMAMQPMHTILVSSDFCRQTIEKIEQLPIAQETVVYQLVGVQLKSHRHVRKQIQKLINEEELALSEDEIYLNDSSIFDFLDLKTLGIIVFLLLLVLMIGYLMISNIFEIIAYKEIDFYRNLSANGIMPVEIRRIVRNQHMLCFVLAVIPASIIGNMLSMMFLPDVMNAFTTIKAEGKTNFFIFMFSILLSYITLRGGQRKNLKMVKRISTVELKNRTYNYKTNWGKNKSCLKKIEIRQLLRNKKRMIKICITLAIGLFLSNMVSVISRGFEEEAYIRSNLSADYIVAKEQVFTKSNLNPLSYDQINESELEDLKALPGITMEGGGAVSYVGLSPSKSVWDNYVKISGDTNAEEKIWTEVYGLDDLLLRELKPISGNLDFELFHTGDYLLIDPILTSEDKTACYQPGEKVTIPFQSGAKKTYTVMAIVEGLPSSCAFPGRYYAGNLYLPMKEWQKMEQKKIYYLFAFEVKKEMHNIWEDYLEKRKKESSDSFSYKSAKLLAKRMQRNINNLKWMGIVLSFLFLFMAGLNFINCMAETIYSQKKELFILKSMGVTTGEIKKGLIMQGMGYIVGGLLLGMSCSAPIGYLIIEKLLAEPYYKYHFYGEIYLAFFVIGILMAAIIPLIFYNRIYRGERLRVAMHETPIHIQIRKNRMQRSKDYGQ